MNFAKALGFPIASAGNGSSRRRGKSTCWKTSSRKAKLQVLFFSSRISLPCSSRVDGLLGIEGVRMLSRSEIAQGEPLVRYSGTSQLCEKSNGALASGVNTPYSRPRLESLMLTSSAKLWRGKCCPKEVRSR